MAASFRGAPTEHLSHSDCFAGRSDDSQELTEDDRLRWLSKWSIAVRNLVWSLVSAGGARIPKWRWVWTVTIVGISRLVRSALDAGREAVSWQRKTWDRVALCVDRIEADLLCVASEIKRLPAPSQAIVELRTTISAL
jgi:hypothetical protein